MGATIFETAAWGRSPEEAFNTAVRDAQHWHGHGGYTGTIAEKSGFSLFTLPPRVTTRKFLDLVAQADAMVADAGVDEYWKDEVRRLEASLVRTSSADKRDVRRQIATLKKEGEKLERRIARWEKNAGDLAPLAKKAAGVYTDKWGPAVAVELRTPGEKKAWAFTLGPRPPHHHERAFLFCGWASC